MQFWNEIISFINANSALWNFMVTIATIVYVVLTHKILKESQVSRKLQNRPYIIADMTVEGICLKVNIRNVGNANASNICVAIDNVENNPFKSIKFLSPGRELSCTISYIRFGENPQEKQSIYHFFVSYNSEFNDDYSDEYDIDVSTLLNSNHSGAVDKDIVDKLDKIVDSLKDVAKSSNEQCRNIEKQTDAIKSVSLRDIVNELDKIQAKLR